MPMRVDTPFGDIFAPEGPCKDDYGNMVVDADHNGGLLKLQRGAMNSFHDAERKLWVRLHPIKARQKKYAKRVQPILVTGSWRSCELQAQLYSQDPNRFADPATTLHCRGLAIDVNQNQKWLRLTKRILLHHGWRQARPYDEPWHFSYWFTA